MVLMKEKLMIFEYQKNLVYNVVSASFFFLKDADRFIYLVTKHISHDDLLWVIHSTRGGTVQLSLFHI